MLLNDIARLLQNELNNSDLTFRVTANEQQWYGYQVRSADSMEYIPAVVRALPIPIITEFYRTRALEYMVTLKGKYSEADAVEGLLNSLSSFELDGKKSYISNFVVTEVSNAKEGFNLTREFIASFRLSVYVTFFLTGADAKLTIDGTQVDFVRLSGAFSKAIVPNREYGENESEVSTGEEYVITLPFSDNEKTVDILNNIMSNKYNKEYEIKVDFLMIEKTIGLVLSNGNFLISNNLEASTFNAVFTRALDRTSIKINGNTVNVIGFTPSMVIVPMPLNKDGRTKVRRESYTTTYQFQLENDKSNTVNDLVGQISNHTNKKFIIEWVFNDVPYVSECIVQSANVPSSENPNAIINVVLIGGNFYGS